MANRQNTLLLKRSNVIGKIPPISGLTLGEMALNTADAKLYSLYTSGTVSPTEVRQIGWDRISRTGDTVTGDFNIFGDVAISGSVLPNGYALTVTGDTDIVGDLYVEGNIDYDGNLVVSGSAVFQSGITANTIYTDYIDFNTTYVPTVQEGRLHWDVDYGTLDVDLEGDNVSLKVGLDNLYYIKNQSGSTINKGRVVRAAGTLGTSGRILGEYMIADGTIPYYFTLGIAGEDILNGEDGYVYEFGLIRGVNTTGSLYGETWVDGTVLYVSPTIPGGLTSFEPTEPNLKIQMAIVIDAAVNGSLFVRPSLGYNLSDLHNVQTSGQTNGDLISYNSSQGYWEYTKSLNGNYTISGHTTGCTLSVTGNTCITGDLDVVGDVTVVGNLLYDGDLIVTGGTLVQNGFTANTITISDTPNLNNNLTQILGRNETTGVVEYRSVNTIGNNYTYVSGSTYSALTTDNVLGVDSSISATTIYLPDSITSGRLRYDIKDIGLNSFNNNITIVSSGSDTIISTENSNTVILEADGGALIIFNTGTGTWLQM